MTNSVVDINLEWTSFDITAAAGRCKERVRDVFAGADAVNTPTMRTSLGLIVASAAVASASALAATAAVPVIRVAPGTSLTVAGTGFAPRALVRVHVVGSGVDRRASVRAGEKGSFVARFAGIARCSVDEVTATTAAGARARVPAAWFVRECPPPPPLAPGVYSAG